MTIHFSITFNSMEKKLDFINEDKVVRWSMKVHILVSL